MKKEKKISVRVTAEQHAALSRKATELGIRISDVLGRFFEAVVKSERMKNEAFKNR